MLLDKPYQRLIEDLGHDGSEILFPSMKEPMCRRGFNITELQHLCWKRGRGLAPFDLDPMTETFHIYPQEELDTRMFDLINRRPGLLEGCYSLDRPHIVAWDGESVYDPTGPRKYTFSDSNAITVRTFWLLL
jgi:hypothetical protein